MRRIAAGAMVGTVFGILAALAALSRPSTLERGEFWSHDFRARAAADPAAASDRIVIVDINEQDIEDAENNYGVTWPWPRAMYGYLATYCARAGARAVVFDWLFQDRGQYSVDDAEEFATAMRDAGNVVIGLALTRRALVARGTEGPWVARLGVFTDRTAAEQTAIKLMAWNVRSYIDGASPATLFIGGKKRPEDIKTMWDRLAGNEEMAALAPAAMQGTDAPAPEQLAPEKLAGYFSTASVIAARDIVDVNTDGLHLPELEGIDPPLSVIAVAPARTGNVYQDIEADGILRRHTLLVRHAGRVYPSLALAALMVGRRDLKVGIDRRTLSLGEHRVVIDQEGKFPIRFHGKDVYPHLAAYEILRSQALLDEGKTPSIAFERLKDKYVIVSASGQALRDIRSTAVSNVHQGAEVQAHALDNLLGSNAIERTSPGVDALVAFFLCLVVSSLVVVLWTATPVAWLALILTGGMTALVLGGFWIATGWLYAARGLWVAAAIPGGGAALGAFATLLATSASERRGRRFVQEALGRYTSPALVRELTEHPEYLSLNWGATRDLSVYFSDIAGFTTISEGMSAEKLVALLNEYLTAMTDIVLQHGGIVDKYIGDAIMAFWGAPLPDTGHARKAVLCAIAMRNRCSELRGLWHQRYGKNIEVRAAVNSGTAVAGNMGSKHKYNYTAMGDTVNLASRLEGANKAYGTELMIAEETLRQIGDAVDVRELDLLAVKGKQKPVRVYEVLDLKGRTEPDLLDAASRFATGLSAYREADFVRAQAAFEAVLKVRPDDGPAQAYIERCQALSGAPPPRDWDGVYRMETK